MTEELAGHYFSLMGESKRQKIINAKDKLKGAQAFVADMLARQSLSELADAPEFSFSLLLNPDSKSVVSNFDAKISIGTADEYVGCAVSRLPIGIALEKAESFTFAEAQSLLTDSEMRNLFSYSKYSFAENLNKEICDERVLQKKFAGYKALKTAQFRSSGRGIRDKRNNISFDCTEAGIVCSDCHYQVIVSEFYEDKNLSVSIIEKVI